MSVARVSLYVLFKSARTETHVAVTGLRYVQLFNCQSAGPHSHSRREAVAFQLRAADTFGMLKHSYGDDAISRHRSVSAVASRSLRPCGSVIGSLKLPHVVSAGPQTDS